MRYRTTYRSRRRKRNKSAASGYLTPFLILICIGVIIVLAVNLWQALFGGSRGVDASMYFVDGSARMKSWGADEFVDVAADSEIKVGDQVVTSGDAKVIIEFFDGTIVRLDGNTDLVFEDMDDDEDDPEIRLLLMDGRIWVNKVYKDTGKTDVIVNMDNVTAFSEQVSNYSVENRFDETVRVISGGEVEVQVRDEDGDKVVESEALGVGQEALFTDEVLQKYWSFQGPDVITAVSEVFERSDWYKWNIAEDKSPTEFLGIGEGNLSRVEPSDNIEATDDGENQEDEETDEEDEDQSENEEESEENEEEEEEEEVPSDEEVLNSNLSKPGISSVAGKTSTNANGVYDVSVSNATLKGTVQGADKVVVNGYELSKFQPGDTSWTYFANAEYGYMKPGDNTYEVVAIDSVGNKSQALTIKVYYTPPAVIEEPEPGPEPEPEVEEPTEEQPTVTEDDNSNEEVPETPTEPEPVEEEPVTGGQTVDPDEAAGPDDI